MKLDKVLDYIKTIDLTTVKGKSLVLSDEAEETLLKICELEQFVEESKEKLKERFLEAARKNPKLKKYQGNRVSVGYRVKRSKILNGNPDERFVIFNQKPNTEAINAYYDATGKFPVGVEEKTFEYITFKVL